ncbi:MAG: YfcE family phosphodiesterase [Eubacterium sp.]
MRIVVTSDSHARQGNLFEVFERHLKNADLFINLGDGEDDVDNVLMLYPNIKIERVAGNCDFYSNYPAKKVISIGGKKIFFTHGHPFGVKHGYDEIQDYAKEIGADICLFGHTHIPYTEYKDGIYFMNPGAVCNGVYGIIDITEQGTIAYNAKI